MSTKKKARRKSEVILKIRAKWVGKFLCLNDLHIGKTYSLRADGNRARYWAGDCFITDEISDFFPTRRAARKWVEKKCQK